MLIAFECDLRGHALMFFFSLRIDGKTANRYLQNFADTREAWNVILRDMGIDPETMKKVGPLTQNKKIPTGSEPGFPSQNKRTKGGSSLTKINSVKRVLSYLVR
jgi:hypothetical protein